MTVPKVSAITRAVTVCALRSSVLISTYQTSLESVSCLFNSLIPLRQAFSFLYYKGPNFPRLLNLKRS